MVANAAPSPTSDPCEPDSQDAHTTDASHLDTSAPSALIAPSPEPTREPSELPSATLLHAFIEARFNVASLLADARFTPDEVIAFVSSPETQAKLADIARVAHLGLTIRAAEARQVAIATLEEVAKNAEDLVEKRRAASALFRATASPLVPLASHQQEKDAPSADQPAEARSLARAKRRLIKHPDLSPIAVAEAAMHTLRANDYPQPDSGYATLSELTEDSITVDGKEVPAGDPTQLKEQLAGTGLAEVQGAPYIGRWIIDPPPEPDANEHTVRYSIGTKRRRFELHVLLRRHPPPQRYADPPTPPPPNRSVHAATCWLIRAVNTALA